MDNIPDLISTAREALGYSMHEASRIAHLSVAHWHQIETGKKIPSFLAMERISFTLKIDPGESKALLEKARDNRREYNSAFRSVKEYIKKNKIDPALVLKCLKANFV